MARPPLLEVQARAVLQHDDVSTSASVIGSRRAPSGQRPDIRSITCVGVRPSRSHPVRARWVPRSRSPRVNHGHPAPHACSSSLTRSLSPGPAPAALGVVHAGERVLDRVDVGLQSHAREPQVVSGVDDDRERGGGVGDAPRPKGGADAEGEPRSADPAGEYDDPVRTAGHGANSSAACGSGNRATASMSASTVCASAMTSTDETRAAGVLRGARTDRGDEGRRGDLGELRVHLLRDRSARDEDRVDAAGADVLGDAVGDRNAHRPVGDDAADPVTGLGQHPGQHRLRDLTAQGQDVARLRLEADHLLRHPGRGVVALGNEVHVVADGQQSGRGGLAHGGDLGRHGDDRAVGVEHIHGRRARDGEPVEGPVGEVGERLLQGRLVVRRREVDEGCDHGRRALRDAASRRRRRPRVRRGARERATRRGASRA